MCIHTRNIFQNIPTRIHNVSNLCRHVSAEQRCHIFSHSSKLGRYLAMLLQNIPWQMAEKRALSESSFRQCVVSALLSPVRAYSRLEAWSLECRYEGDRVKKCNCQMGLVTWVAVTMEGSRKSVKCQVNLSVVGFFKLPDAFVAFLSQTDSINGDCSPCDSSAGTQASMLC